MNLKRLSLLLWAVFIICIFSSCSAGVITHTETAEIQSETLSETEIQLTSEAPSRAETTEAQELTETQTTEVEVTEAFTTASTTEKETSKANKKHKSKTKSTTEKAKESNVSEGAQTALSNSETQTSNEAQTVKNKSKAPSSDNAQSGRCTISIQCKTLLDNADKLKAGHEGYVPENGIILERTTRSFGKNDTVYTVLYEVCEERGIKLNVRSTLYGKYVAGINELDEFDAGKNSGWMYTVNGKIAAVACSSYKPKNGDVIEFYYVC